jgi:hypothetical protein
MKIHSQHAKQKHTTHTFIPFRFKDGNIEKDLLKRIKNESFLEGF